MKFIPTEIPDVILIEPKVFPDGRGFFFESYRKDLFEKNGIHTDFVQDNHSRSAKGVLRGLHYQVAPKEQAKLVCATRGAAFDVVVDIRKGSKTFGQWVGNVLSEEKKNLLYIPAGFAHGFLALEDGTELSYKVSDVYSPLHERGILWNDPGIGIVWPECGAPVLLSEKDKKYPVLKDVSG